MTQREEMLDDTEKVQLTFECLRAAACGGNYEQMDAVALQAAITMQLGRLSMRPTGKEMHDIYSKVAAASLIMAMRLDHVDKVYE